MCDNDSSGGDSNSMTEMLDWIRRMIFLGIFLTMIVQVLPSGSGKKYVRFFAGMVFVLTILNPLFTLLGEKNVEQILEKELFRKDVLQSGQLDFTYMERRQREYYEKQTKDAVERMIRQTGESCGIVLQKVDVKMEKDSGAVAQVCVWTTATEAQTHQEIRRQIGAACGISEQQVEVYET